VVVFFAISGNLVGGLSFLLLGGIDLLGTPSPGRSRS
jgi:hypothetical protein